MRELRKDAYRAHAPQLMPDRPARPADPARPAADAEAQPDERRAVMPLEHILRMQAPAP